MQDIPSEPTGNPLHAPGAFAVNPLMHKDRRVALLMFGILLILLGLMYLFSTASSVLQVFIYRSFARATPAGAMGLSLGGIVCNALSMLLFAVAAGWLGFGSILCKRWARSLVAAGTAVFAFSGVLFLIMLLCFLPAGIRAVHIGISDGAIERQAAPFIYLGIVLIVLFLVVFMIGIPSLMFLVYRSENARITCELADLKTRWTDGCPLAVLILCVAQVMMAHGMIAYLGHQIFPWFGDWIRGVPAIGTAGAVIALFLVLALGCWRLHAWAWWGTVIFWIVLGVSAVMTFLNTSFLDFVILFAGFSDEELLNEMGSFMERVNAREGIISAGWIVASLLAVLGYLVWIRPHFGKARTDRTQGEESGTAKTPGSRGR